MIQNFDEFINESNKLPLNPEIGDTVKGIYGGKYTILDFCEADDKGAVNTLLRKYDSSGAMKDEVIANRIPSGMILVALEDEDETTSVWQWSDKWLKIK